MFHSNNPKNICTVIKTYDRSISVLCGDANTAIISTFNVSNKKQQGDIAITTAVSGMKGNRTSVTKSDIITNNHTAHK